MKWPEDKKLLRNKHEGSFALFNELIGYVLELEYGYQHRCEKFLILGIRNAQFVSCQNGGGKFWIFISEISQIKKILDKPESIIWKLEQGF